MQRRGKRFREYLFYQHAQETVETWLNKLDYFYFHRAMGGHYHDGDYFEAYFKVQKEEVLKLLTKQLHLELEEFPEEPKPIPGKLYTLKAFKRFRAEIKHYTKHKQLDKPKLLTTNFKIWINSDDVMRIYISGGKQNYEVNDIDFEDCLLLETFFKEQGIVPYRTKEIEERTTIITKSKYPEFFGPFEPNLFKRFIDKML